MKSLHFKILIDSPKSKVWNTLWDDKNYREWTSVFTPDSYALSDWEEGSKVQFLDSKGSGMYSIIEKKVDNTLMRFKHLGEIKDGVEEPQPSWGNAYEIYNLIENQGQTELQVQVDTLDEFEKYFADTFPQGMEKIKEIAERL